MERTTGTLRYSKVGEGPFGYVLVAYVDPEIARYARALIPPWMPVQPPMYKPHVTAVRCGRDAPDLARWGEYEGREVLVEYDPRVRSEGLYYWLDAWSEEITLIRESLGIFVRRLTWHGNRERLHVTVGNRKHSRP